ncbi:complex I intermediate-associated protein CIA30 [Sanghuangporus baumii]|uniref:Complex I intermediate-associated protein CIA30 n=1 Tax=Sanghuangporus baumii TaxID=108892 RepID=A0A9Q5HRS7_SANBA|nr:complex I intermediate-associated protein CIA30 [Sanghuangporus baumii]
MASKWAAFMTRWNRSTQVLRDNTSAILRMDGLNPPNRSPMSLCSFNTKEDLQRYSIGVDSDVGGTSTARLDFVPNPHDSNGKGTARFWGDMRLGSRPTLFGELADDISNHEYLALRVRAGGHPRTRNAYFVNLQTDSPISGELWQHRLYFRRNDGSWEDIFIPFSAFALTSYGELATGRASEVTIEEDRIRWLGISLLGGNAGVAGPFELGLDSIKAVNQEDVHTPPIVDQRPRDVDPEVEDADENLWQRDRTP